MARIFSCILNTCVTGVYKMLVVSEDTVVKVLLLVNADLRNGQLFQKIKTQNCQRLLEIKQLQSGLLSNIARLRLI